MFSWLHIYYTHLAVRFEHSVCHGSLMASYIMLSSYLVEHALVSCFGSLVPAMCTMWLHIYIYVYLLWVWVFKIFPTWGGGSNSFHKKGWVGKNEGGVFLKRVNHLFSHQLTLMSSFCVWCMCFARLYNFYQCSLYFTEKISLIESNQQKCCFCMWVVFEKQRHCWPL